LPRNAQKRTKKKKKYLKYVRTFFCELAQMYVVFSGFFFCRPSTAGSFGLGELALPAKKKSRLAPPEGSYRRTS
jgi:hypothetical protein